MKLCFKSLLIAVAAALAPFTMAIADEPKTILVQSTTSTQNSGLFDAILPKFTKQTGITVHVVAVGTGQSLKNGRKGDGDVLLVHAKAAEDKFVAQGYGVERFDVMYNDFIILGPSGDPAAVSGTKDILTALKKISARKSAFVSRGDDSGTNKKELQLWRQANVDVKKDSGTWYRESGSGMGATLNIAVGMNAYTMSDRATWIAFANKKNMKIVSEGDKRLFNQYGVILVNPKKHPHVKAAEGNAFINWLTGPGGQSAIAAYRRGGKPLFFPNAK